LLLGVKGLVGVGVGWHDAPPVLQQYSLNLVFLDWIRRPNKYMPENFSETAAYEKERICL
jgi:hypothetical protein